MIDKHPSIDPVHPGEILREDVFPTLSMSEAAVADALKVSRQTLCDVLSGKQPVTAEIAVRLGKLLGNGPALWINLQRAYDLAIAQRSVDVSGIPTLDVHPDQMPSEGLYNPLETTMSVLRSLLFVPGNRANMLQKAMGSAPDAFIPDLEDSVPIDEKTQARDVTASFLPQLAQVGPRVIPRVNSLDTGLLEEDLAAVVGPHVYGVSVGKISTPADVAAVDAVLAKLEAKAGLPRGHVKLVPWIETALAIVKAYDICTASPRIVGVAFGAEDLTHDMGIERSEDDAEVAYSRNVLCVAARAAEVLALDTPYFGFRDPEGLQRNAQASRKIGFKGKFAIHPAQVDLINAAFSPSEAEVEHARRVVAAFEEAERQGRGSTSLDGQVVDVPVVKRARALLEAAASLR